MYDNNWYGEQLTLMRNVYGYCDNNPINAVDPSGLDSVKEAVKQCLSLPTVILQLKCLDDIAGLTDKAKKVLKCEVAYAAYKAASAASGGCLQATDCSTLLAMAAGAAAEVAGRAAYLNMKCDYVLTGSTNSKIGSAAKEKNHQIELANKTKFAKKCADRAAQFCKQTSCSPIAGPVIG